MIQKTVSLKEIGWRDKHLSRFEKKIDKSGHCWKWIGAKNGSGYGMFYIDLKAHRAHRISWMLTNMKNIDGGKFVCHSCDNPICVNPKHLWLGSNLDNQRDCKLKGRHSLPPLKKKRSHCKYGHRFTLQNSYVYEFGRMCKTCTLKRSKARKLKLKMEKKNAVWIKCN